MIEAQLSAFDATVLGITALSALVAFFRGFVKEVLSLGAWVGAGLVTIYYFPEAAKMLSPHIKSPTIAAGLGTLGLYIAALMGFSLINTIILKFVKTGSDIGMLDNSLGLAFGLFRGMFIVSLGMLMITMVMTEKEYPRWLKEAKTRPLAEYGAVMLAQMAPEYLQELTNLRHKLDGKLKEKGQTNMLKFGDESNEDETGNEESLDGRETIRQLDAIISNSRKKTQEQ